MRPIIIQYAGTCVACGAALAVGAPAVYERRVGCFCPTCAPTDPEEIRALRTAGAERKAARFDEWAAKREARAEAQLTSYPELRRDHAFNTQPGHIPARARMNAADARACASLAKARAMRAKAASLRNVRVAGDAERAREKERAAAREWVTVGALIVDPFYGLARVLRVNRKTVSCQREDGATFKSCLSWIEPAEREGASDASL